jgi:hypothetical protein
MFVAINSRSPQASSIFPEQKMGLAIAGFEFIQMDETDRARMTCGSLKPLDNPIRRVLTSHN